jgi:hypothetical protein
VEQKSGVNLEILLFLPLSTPTPDSFRKSKAAAKGEL